MAEAYPNPGIAVPEPVLSAIPVQSAFAFPETSTLSDLA